MSDDDKPYRCTGCERRFDGWAKMREHHGKCTVFRGGRLRERDAENLRVALRVEWHRER